MEQFVSIEPLTIKSQTAVSFSVRVIDVDLGCSVTVVARLYDSSQNMIDTQIHVIYCKEYYKCNDDTYLHKYIAGVFKMRMNSVPDGYTKMKLSQMNTYKNRTEPAKTEKSIMFEIDDPAYTDVI